MFTTRRATSLLIGIVAVAGLLGCQSPPRDVVEPPASSDIPTPPASEEPKSEDAKETLPGTSDTEKPTPVVTNGSREGKRIALTFDADMTDFMWGQLDSGEVKSQANLPIFDMLEEQKVPATFFLTGMWAERYPELTERIAANPDFQIANHSYEHMGFTPDCYELGEIDVKDMVSDVQKTFDILEPYGGNQSRYFRFPGGCYDDTALSTLQPLGITAVQWDVVSGDPFATSAQPLVNAVLDGAKAGSIVVMHCNEGNAEYTDDALGPILDGLRDQGFEFATLSEVLGE